MKLKKEHNGYWTVNGFAHGRYGIAYYHFGRPHGRFLYAGGSIENYHYGMSHGHQKGTTLPGGSPAQLLTMNGGALSGIHYRTLSPMDSVNVI